MERLRHKLSVLVLWCVFLALYVGGAAMLGVGLFLASQEWWVVLHQHTSMWLISAKTVEMLIVGLGFLLILIIPLFQPRSVGRSGDWRAEHRSETKCRVPVAE
jgi:hypothetical protein